ncbi:hypothetical protein CBS147320_3728 [Aspergillus niger]|nr:hypothetical protein CBS147320_3728 [Aspergillus niger]KAI2984006.1 hypothetical protein CBS147344_7317 [Aspergillus niger]
MNRVLALPALFFCLFTYTPSYTTFNLIFFYMTWTTLILSHSPFKVELFGSIGVRLLFYILPSALLFLFDALVPSAAVLLKAHGEQGLPTGSKRRGVRVREIKVAGWSFLNIFISIAVQAAIETLRIGYFNTRSALKVSFTIPIIPWNIAFHLACVLLLREILAYTIHRFVLHNDKYRITRYISSLHQTWYHSLHAPYPSTAHYDHPIPYLLGNTVPTLLPAVFLRLHMITYAMYLSIVSLEETLAYSGYSAMPMDFFLLGGIARRVEKHLLNRAAGNFGPWGIVDWFCQTTIGDEEGEVLIADTEDDEDEPTPVLRGKEIFEAKVQEALDSHAKKTQRKHRKKLKQNL